MTERVASSKEFPSKTSRVSRLIMFLVHILCLLVYLIPITTHPYKQGAAVLDESHIVSPDNHDVQGTSSLRDVFINDYWGRPMNSPSSHKSWRPLTVLSFRWLRFGTTTIQNELFYHRIVNVLANAVTGEAVSIAAVLLFPNLTFTQTLVMRIVTKLVFCLHPTHVEVTANAANRPHLLAVLCSIVMVDPRIHIVWDVLFQMAGLLCSETFLFQMPAVLMTLTAIKFQQQEQRIRQQSQQSSSTEKHNNKKLPLSSLTTATSTTMVSSLLPRYALVIMLSIIYIVGRHVFDTLSIPDGLIRPAENPFYDLTGMRRVRNYAYVLAIHVSKSMLVDFIGFSHEYGFECIREVTSWSDVRLLIPLGMVMVAVLVTVYCVKRGGLMATLVWLVYLSWLATLFPISGVIKVGTFVADRIVVASTVSFAILVGRFVATWIFVDDAKKHGDGDDDDDNDNDKRTTRLHRGKAAVVVAVLAYLWIRVHNRTLEWMDGVPLLQSSLRTCPRNMKSNLEISKVYSGLYPEMFNLTLSRQHLEMVESIDPDYCDVHQQFAHVAIQEGKVFEFEERLVKAVMCPFSMGGAVEMWKRYWEMALKDPHSGSEARIRYQNYTKILEEAIEKATEEEKEKQKARLSSSRRSSEL